MNFDIARFCCFTLTNIALIYYLVTIKFMFFGVFLLTLKCTYLIISVDTWTAHFKSIYCWCSHVEQSWRLFNNKLITLQIGLNITNSSHVMFLIVVCSYRFKPKEMKVIFFTAFLTNCVRAFFELVPFPCLSILFQLYSYLLSLAYSSILKHVFLFCASYTCFVS